MSLAMVKPTNVKITKKPRFNYDMLLHVHKKQTDKINILIVAKIFIYVSERKNMYCVL